MAPPRVAWPYDLAVVAAVVVADGLSASAVRHNPAPPLAALLHPLQADVAQPCAIGTMALVQPGWVAIGDEVGQNLGARFVVVLIGERPGLSPPASMGVYLTWSSHVGCSDMQRNCISNVRPGGLGADAAADKLHYLLRRARVPGLRGVELKDESALPDPVSSKPAPALAPASEEMLRGARQFRSSPTSRP